MKYPMLFLLGITLLLRGCYSTKPTGYWTSPELTRQTYRKILVLGMMPDSLLRGRMEAHIAGDLTDMGIPAITASAGFDTFSFIKTEDKDVMRQFSEAGIDGVLTISLLNKSTEGFFLPGSLYYLLSDQYAKDYFRLFTPEFYKEADQYLFESNFYSVKKGARLFATQTMTFDPASLEKMAHEYGKVVTKELRKHGIVSRQ